MAPLAGVAGSAASSRWVASPGWHGALRSATMARWTVSGKARRSGVEQADGSQRAAIFVGEAEATWFGGAPGAYVAYPDTHSGEEVAFMRIVPRDEAA